MADPALQRLQRLRSHLLAPAAVGTEAAPLSASHSSTSDVQSELQTLLEHDSWKVGREGGPGAFGACSGHVCGAAQSTAWRVLPVSGPQALFDAHSAAAAAACATPRRALSHPAEQLPSCGMAGTRHHEGADALGAVCAALRHPTGGGARAGAASPAGALHRTSRQLPLLPAYSFTPAACDPDLAAA